MIVPNGSGGQGSIPGRYIPKTQIMVLDASLLNTQQYKVGIKGKVEQSKERSTPSLHFAVVAIKKGALGLPSTKDADFTLLNCNQASRNFNITHKELICL